MNIVISCFFVFLTMLLRTNGVHERKYSAKFTTQEENLSAESLLLSVLQSPSIPVVYIMFGTIPDYLLYTVEMTSTNNPVILLTDSITTIWTSLSPSQSITKAAFYVPMHQYISDLPAFEKIYKPIRLTSDNGQRQHYELRCIERWLVLHSFSVKNNISKLFYGDNDNVLFGNVSSTVERRRWIHHFDNGTENDELNRLTGGTCEAMVSVEGHMSEHDFLGGG